MNKGLNKKISAFTLPEAMITLTLSVIIISMAYFSYNYLMQGFIKYRQINENIAAHCRATNYLDIMLQRSDEVCKTKEGLVFKKDGKEIKNLVFNETYLLFKNSAYENDTVKIELKKVTFLWKEDSVLTDRSPVQKIQLEINFSGRQHRLIFEKMYDSEKLIKLDSLYTSLK